MIAMLYLDSMNTISFRSMSSVSFSSAISTAAPLSGKGFWKIGSLCLSTMSATAGFPCSNTGRQSLA